MKDTVVGLQMSQSVLISHHNVHTALLEWHRQVLTTITSQPPMPSNQQTPFEDGDAMYHLSMPPSCFSSSPQPSNSMMHFPIPLLPLPHPPTHPVSPLPTLRMSRLFTKFIHPSMVELNKLNILMSPSCLHRYHTAPDIYMEDLPGAGPLHVAQAQY